MARLAAGHKGSAFFKAFIQGLAVMCVIYAVLGAWLWLSRGETLARQAARSPSVTVPIMFAPADLTPAPALPPAAVLPNATPVPPATTGGPAAPPAPAAEVATAPVPAPTTSETGGAQSLPPAPVEGLFEVTSQGRLPVKRADGMTPFQAYRRPFDRQAVKSPLVSLVVTDAGLSAMATQAALSNLPADVTFVLSPYAAAPDDTVREARAGGHEIWLTLPMESEDYPRVDTGPQTLLVGATPAQNEARLRQVLGRASGYAGVMTSQNPAFMKAAAELQPVLNSVYGRGLAFADASADPTTVPQTMAMAQNAPYTNVDIWLDLSATPDDIRAALGRLEDIARRNGGAVGLIRPLPVSLQQAGTWVDGLAARGFVLAPLSAQTGM